MFGDLLGQVNFAYIFVAAVLFVGGIYFAPAVVDRNINWLLAYPRWVARLMEKYFSARWGFIPIFLIILILNNFSLFSGFVSGFLVIFPFLIAFFTGFNVSVIGYDMAGWKGVWQMLINPVAWLEFPAAWISFALGFRLASLTAENGFAAAGQAFHTLLPLYFKYVFSLLLVAAILESLLIVWAERHKDQL